jgi:hypothetical protein
MRAFSWRLIVHTFDTHGIEKFPFWLGGQKAHNQRLQ